MAASDDVGKRKEIDRSRREVERRQEQGYYHGRPPLELQFDNDGQYLVPGEISRTLVRRQSDVRESLSDTGKAYKPSKSSNVSEQPPRPQPPARRRQRPLTRPQQRHRRLRRRMFGHGRPPK